MKYAARAWTAIGFALLLWFLLWPSEALACPACARPDAGPRASLLVGSMIALPFVVGAIIYKVLRRGGYLDRAEGAPARGPSATRDRD